MSCMSKFLKCVTCTDEAKFPNPYNFEFGNKESWRASRVAFESNFVKTSKYTWYDFLPSMPPIT